MYLEYFGLAEPPFRITPVTVFFFPGANRGEILEALIYSLSEAEGIIKVSGEVGSGKTMLCRMLLERLPAHVETIYLANPSLSREEMLYAIADGLGLNCDNDRIGVIMRDIQNKLEEKAQDGKRIVVLVDEAHAMPLDTLEELRLLYNLQVGNSKLLQIILFGQPELNTKLEQPNMRQVKDRIVHHFHMQPLSRSILESYLMFRMRAAGYHGPNIFSANALKLIADASHGLMRRVNILADKALLAAFVEDTHSIETRHALAAIRDSELRPARSIPGKRIFAGAVAGLLLTGLCVWWVIDRSPDAFAQLTTQDPRPVVSLRPDTINNMPATTATQTDIRQTDISVSATIANGQSAVSVLDTGQDQTQNKAATNTTLSPATADHSNLPAKDISRFEQRLSAGKQLIEQKKTIASIQLFYKEEFNKERIEEFLKRADGLGKLSDIYLLPANFGKKNGLRIVYGAYPSIEIARSAIKDLPARYLEAFATSIYIF